MIENAGTFETVEIPEKENSSINFLYNTIPGRILLRVLVKTSVSKLAGLILNSPASRIQIKSFIKRNNIDMDQYRYTKFKSFNDFFIREIKEGFRSFPDSEHDLAAPGDGKLTAYTISADSVFNIKHSKYSVSDLLDDKNLADEFNNGVCLIFRLTPDDYHRYVFIDDAEIVSRKRINGKLHTVRPIAYRNFDVFCQNTREYVVMQTKNFGKVIQMEVGALFVGRISNYNDKINVKRGEEKGMFQFGGSTVILLFRDNEVTISKKIYENTLENKETIVKMGNKLTP